jgi:uncharacterized protein
VPLRGYGGGGFRFEEQRVTGAICILPEGIFAWRPQSLKDITEEDFAAGLAARAETDFLLFGMGARHLPPPSFLVRACALAGMGLECMTTAAAVRTYNVCRDEERLPATFLLPVD